MAKNNVDEQVFFKVQAICLDSLKAMWHWHLARFLWLFSSQPFNKEEGSLLPRWSYQTWLTPYRRSMWPQSDSTTKKKSLHKRKGNQQSPTSLCEHKQWIHIGNAEYNHKKIKANVLKYENENSLPLKLFKYQCDIKPYGNRGEGTCAKRCKLPGLK